MAPNSWNRRERILLFTVGMIGIPIDYYLLVQASALIVTVPKILFFTILSLPSMLAAATAIAPSYQEKPKEFKYCVGALFGYTGAWMLVWKFPYHPEVWITIGSLLLTAGLFSLVMLLNLLLHRQSQD